MAVLEHGSMHDVPTSPELALVDPELALGGSAVIDVVAAAVARPPVRAPMLVVVADDGERRSPVGLVAARGQILVDTLSHRRATIRPLRAVQAAVGILTAALLLAAVTDRGAPEPDVTPQLAAGVTPNATTLPPTYPAAGAASSAQSAPPTRSPAQRQPSTRRLAWAPADGAIAYDVELFLAGERVLARRTSRPVLEVPERWRSDGVARALVPGEYRWYVWPIGAGGRASAAIVQAQLVVS